MGIKRKKKTIKRMLLAPMLAVNLLIVLIFVSTLVSSNIFQRVKESEVDYLARMVGYRGDQVQRLFHGLASTTAGMAVNIQQDLASLGRDGSVRGALQSSPETTAAALQDCLPYLVDTLKINEATGAFVVLDSTDVANGAPGGQMAAIYINDEDLSTISDDNADLMLLYGPNAIARDLFIGLDSDWSTEMQLSDFDSSAFITQPLSAAMDDPNLNMEQLGCWRGPITRQDGKRITTYSIPLRDKNNIPFGVVGIELSADVLKTKIRPTEMSSPSDSFYVIARVQEGMDPVLVTQSGAPATKYMQSGSATYRLAPAFNNKAYEFTFSDGSKATGSVYVLDLNYTSDSGAWVLIGAVANKFLFSSSSNLMQFFITAVCLSLFVGLLMTLLAAHWFVSPITRLSRQLQSIDPDVEIKLAKTEIKEIDWLIGSIESLSADLMQTGQRTLDAIEMTEMPIGFLEINRYTDRVFLTDLLFEWLGVEKDGDSSFIPFMLWQELYARLLECKEPKEDNVYLLDFVKGAPPRWLRVKLAESKDKTFGIIIDVTNEIHEKMRLEFERDTDPLTGLFNRQAFFSLSERLVHSSPDKKGVMLFADLDNLKYVNDTYGHDFGDRYIRTAAAGFSQLSEQGGVVARISGDEFAMFLYGNDTREELADMVTKNYRAVSALSIELPDAEQFNLRFSMGFSWYPDDSSNLQQLLKYADFAMYETKRTTKGSMKEFNLESYMKNSFLIEKNEGFNQFLEEHLVSYVFQPIIDIFSGNIFAYEALMRPQTQEFSTPHQVLQIAESQSKLYQIERMTVFNVFEWMQTHEDDLNGRRIFFNSILGQTLSDKDVAEMGKKYPLLGRRIVMELSEMHKIEEDLLIAKLKSIRQYGAAVAIDTLGMTEFDDETLERLGVDYIKIDMSLVRDIHKESGKQQRVRDILRFARGHGIKTVAQGVERYEEAELLICLGVDYLQGFYLAPPSEELVNIPNNVKNIIRRLAAQYHNRRKEKQ